MIGDILWAAFLLALAVVTAFLLDAPWRREIKR